MKEPDTVRKFIASRLKVMRLSMTAVSRLMNRNDAYLQQFLARGTPKKLDEEDRRNLARILQVDERELRHLDENYPQNSQRGAVDTAGRIDSNNPIGNPRIAVQSPDLWPRDLPVVKLTRCASGDGFTMSRDQVIDWASRPPEVSGAKDAFGFFVDVISMEPAVRRGDFVVINPARPAVSGDLVVVEVRTADGPACFLKELAGLDAETVTVLQYNPHKKTTYKAREVTALLRVASIRKRG